MIASTSTNNSQQATWGRHSCRRARFQAACPPVNYGAPGATAGGVELLPTRASSIET